MLQEKYLTPDWIFRFKNTLLSAPVLMVDANLSHPSLEAACKSTLHANILILFYPLSVGLWTNYKSCSFPLHKYLHFSVAIDMECPVWFEPVSVTKSRRISSIVEYVSAMLYTNIIFFIRSISFMVWSNVFMSKWALQ